jgi:hypothetical protein
VKLPPPGPLPCGPCFGCGREIEVVIRKGRPECGAAVVWLPDMVLTPRLPRPLRASRHRLGSRAAGRGASHWRQTDRESLSEGRCALGADRAAERFDDTFREGEAKARAGALAGGVRAEEGFGMRWSWSSIPSSASTAVARSGRPFARNSTQPGCMLVEIRLSRGCVSNRMMSTLDVQR